MSESIVTEIVGTSWTCVEAPAGCGKTTLIVQSVKAEDKRQLILTHTHAGVHSLKLRFQHYKVNKDKYNVTTIASWALRWAAAYSEMTGENVSPFQNDWTSVYEACLILLDNHAVQRAIQVSYAGLYVDEYQDCDIHQHKLIMKLGGIIPCRIFGDPLQGIFEFNETLVSWEDDVVSNFSIKPLNKPWRWAKTNPKLGQSLNTIRQNLLNGNSINLEEIQHIEWRKKAPQSDYQSADNQYVDYCKRIASKYKGERISIIQKIANKRHHLARRLAGKYSVIEPFSIPDLFKAISNFETADETEMIMQVVEFASWCRTKLNRKFRATLQNYLSNSQYEAIAEEHRQLLQAVQGFTGVESLIDILNALDSIKGSQLFRRELWLEMRRTLKSYSSNKFQSLFEAAEFTRNQTRFFGRPQYKHIIASTYLIKGLEYNHSVILDADELDTKNLYVALTRANTMVFVVSNSCILPNKAVLT